MIACLVVASAGRTSAGVIVFTDRVAWEAAVSGAIVTEDFNGLPFGALSTGVNSAGLIDINVIGGPNLNAIVPGTNAFNIDGTTFFRGETALTGSSPGTAELIFDVPVTAFGADWTSTLTSSLLVADLGPTGSVKFSDHLSSPGSGFLGVVSDTAFGSVLFDVELGANEIFGMDNLSYAPIPEPTSLAIFGLGAIGLVGLGRRRKRRVARM